MRELAVGGTKRSRGFREELLTEGSYWAHQERRARCRNGEEPGDGEAVMTKRTGRSTSSEECWERRWSHYTERSYP